MKKERIFRNTVMIVFLSVTVLSGIAAANDLGSINIASASGVQTTLAGGIVSGSVLQQLAVNAAGENKNVIAKNDSVIKQQAETSASENSMIEDLGPQFREIARSIYQFLVLDDTNSDSEQGNISDDSFAVAMTSQYLNDRLLSNGMQLEFHASPMNGGGGIFLKKTF